MCGHAEARNHLPRVVRLCLPSLFLPTLLQILQLQACHGRHGRSRPHHLQRVPPCLSQSYRPHQLPIQFPYHRPYLPQPRPEATVARGFQWARNPRL